MHVRVCVNVVVLLVVLPTEAAEKCGVCEKGLGRRRCIPCPAVPVTQGEDSTVSALPSNIAVPTLARPTPALLVSRVATDNVAASSSTTTTLPSGMLVSSLSSTTSLHQLSSDIPLQTSFYIHDGPALDSGAHVLTRTTAELVFTGKGTPTLTSGIPTSSPLSTSSYDVSTQWSSEISLGMSFSSSDGTSSTVTHFNDVTSVKTYSSDVDHSLRGCEFLDCTFKPHSGPALLWTMLDSERYHMRAQCAEWCGRLADCTYFVYVADSEMCNVYASDGTQSSESKMMIWIKVHC